MPRILSVIASWTEEGTSVSTVLRGLICRWLFSVDQNLESMLNTILRWITLDVICAAGLAGSFGVMTKVLRSLELNKNYRATVLGEPQLGKRGLYPSISIKESYAAVERQMNLLAYADGSPLLDIAEKIGVPAWELSDTVEKLVSHGLLSSEN